MTLRRAVVSALLIVVSVGVARADATHTVRKGQTLFSIARAYGITVQRLAMANNITDPTRVSAGQRLVIPGVKGGDRRGADPAPQNHPPQNRPPQSRAPQGRTPQGRPPQGRSQGPPQARPAVATKPVPATLSPAVAALFSGLQWPVDGPVISEFLAPRRGPRRHKGIDIKSPEGAPVRAVADGVVTVAEDHHGLYGRLIVLDHGSGVTSYYGHNSRNLVEEGQRVSAGDVIALVGRSGNASTEHLHFELRVEGEALDPATLLPEPSTPRVITAAIQRAPAGPAASRAVARDLYPPEPGKGPPPE